MRNRIMAVVGAFARVRVPAVLVVGAWAMTMALYPSPGQAHDVIVERETSLLKSPAHDSSVMVELKQGAEVKLLENLPVDGYYHVFHKRGNGWVASDAVTIRQEYERGDWRHWIDADKDGQDTRAKVLVEESLEPVVFKDEDKRAVVKSGRWLDPYTGKTFTLAKDLDVDHMVPLMNAHVSGGWLWDWERRREFANDQSFPDHLIAVSKSANRSKGAKGPEKWKPPEQDYWCAYARNWEHIKQRWNLSMTQQERKSVEEMKSLCR